MKQKKVHKLDESIVIEGQVIRQPICAAWADDLTEAWEAVTCKRCLKIGEKRKAETTRVSEEEEIRKGTYK